MGDLFPSPPSGTGSSAETVGSAAAQHPDGTRIRSRLLRIGTTLVVVAVLAGFLAAVATKRLPFGATTTNPVRGGSIVDALFTEPDTLLPFRTGENSGVIVDQALWAPLWYGDPQGAFHPGIAAEVPSSTNGDISPDLTTWTIHLRSGLTWSDGSPLTAADCAFSFNLYADPAYGAAGFPTTAPNDPIGFASATAPDSTTVVIQLKHPFVAMPAVLADGADSCLPREVFGSIKPADISQSPENFQPTVVSGPFTLKERVAGDHVTVVRNLHYYQGPQRPYLDQITFKVFASPDDRLAALQTHAVDTAWFLDPTQLASARAIPGYTTYLDRNPLGFEVLVFNLTDPLTGDHAVRQAFTMGFNTSEVLSFVYGAAELTCDDAAGTFAHEPSLVPCYHFNPSGANAILDADGWTGRAPAGCTIGQGDCYRTKNGQTLQLVLATTGFQRRQDTAALLRRELAGIGMKIVVKTYSVEDYFGCGRNHVLAGGIFQVAEFASGGGYDSDDHSFFASDQTPDNNCGSNYMRYVNAEVDQQERVQQSTADVTARKAAFHIIHEDVLKDLPVMYLYAGKNIACARSDLHNYDPSAFAVAEAWNVWDWWLGASRS